MSKKMILLVLFQFDNYFRIFFMQNWVYIKMWLAMIRKTIFVCMLWPSKAHSVRK